MSYKKILIFLCLMIAIFTVSSVAASDVNDAIVANDDSQENNEISIQTDEILKENEESKTITELNNIINGNENSTITLEHDYKYNDSDSSFTDGIKINRGVTIDGKGHTIDGGKKIRIFQITASSPVTIENINFINGFTSVYGGAIYAKDATATIINCTFTHNEAGDEGGNFGGALYYGTAINCTFTYNYAYNGGAMAYSTAINCTFENNRAIDKVHPQSHTKGGAMCYGTAINCTFRDNDADYGQDVYGTSITFDNMNNAILYNGDKLSFKGIPNNKVSVKVYKRGQLIVEDTFKNMDGWTINLHAGTYVLNCSVEGDEYTINPFSTKIIVKSKSSMSELQDLIANSQNPTIILDKDYSSNDGDDLENGIEINRDLTIDGNGHVLDGFNTMRIFHVNGAAKVTFKNIEFINGFAGYTGHGSAVEGNDATTIINCTFFGSNGYYGTVSSGTVINSTFIENKAVRGGALYQATAINCKFIQNNATYGGAMYEGTATNCEFINNSEDGLTDLFGTKIIFQDNDFNITQNTTKVLVFNHLPKVPVNLKLYKNGTLINESTFTSTEGLPLNLEAGQYYANCSVDTLNFAVVDFYVNIHSKYTSITDLNSLINDNQNQTIVISDDYEYLDSDFAFNKGIEISRDLTIIGNGNTIDGKGKMRLFQITNNAKVTFINLKFINGYYDVYDGGAIYGACSVINSTFINNKGYDGGALYEGSAINCSFINNVASRYGGAMYRGTATNCNFTNNAAEGEHFGGATYETDAVNSIFTKNSAYVGGAMDKGTATNCTFKDNKATFGGATDDVEAVNCTFINNQAVHISNSDGVGGAMYKGSATNSTFINNKAEYGGAIREGEATNCIFKNNAASKDGGAMYKGTATNCEFIENSAVGWGNDTYETTINFDIEDFNTIPYSCERLMFKGLPKSDVTIKLYKGETLINESTCISTEGWVVNLTEGTYTAECSAAFDHGPNKEFTVTINVVDKHLIDPNLIVNVDNITAGQPVSVEVSTNETFSGNVTLKLNSSDVIYTVIINKGSGSLSIDGLKAGKYTATVSFNATDVFDSSTVSKVFEVYPKPLIDPDLKVSVENITVGQSVLVEINTNATFSGNVTLKLNSSDKIYTVKIVDGVGSCTIPDLTVGSYIATVTFDDTDVFKASTVSKVFGVNPKPLIDPELQVMVNHTAQGNPALVEVRTNKTFSGNVSLKLNTSDESYTVKIVDGYGNYSILDLAIGKYTATVTFNATDVFKQSTASDEFEVYQKDLISPNLAIKINDITEGEIAQVEVTANTTFSGEVSVKINNNNYTVTVTDGYGSIPVINLEVGNYTATASSEKTDVFAQGEAMTSFSVIEKEVPPVIVPVDPNLIITVSSITVDSNVIITITTNATFSGNVNVMIGSKNYIVNVKNGKGTTSVSGLKVGTYTAVATFAATEKFKTSTKSATFKVKAHVIKLTLKKVKVKRSAKKLYITATLKIDGKAVKGKKLKFKFKNKSYTARTNKKGVAKIKIKKNVLKKLKKGKKVTYKVSYGKKTVKRTVKVKK